MIEEKKLIIPLKELRRRAGLTQHQLASILDMRIKTISDWERGIVEPRISASKILLLCQTLDCSLEELVLAIQASQSSSNKELALAS